MLENINWTRSTHTLPALLLVQLFSHSSSEYTVLKSKVTPNQKVRDEAHDVWIAIDKAEENAVVAWCSCTSGHSQSCNHVMALLYKVAYPVTRGFTKSSFTSFPWMWNTHTHREPKKIKDLKFREDIEWTLTKKVQKEKFHQLCKENLTQDDCVTNLSLKRLWAERWITFIS